MQDNTVRIVSTTNVPCVHTFENTKRASLDLQFPDCYEEAVIKLVHHATLKEDELSQRVVSYFKDRFVSGETVFGIHDGQEKNCKIIAALDPSTAGHDCESRPL